MCNSSCLACTQHLLVSPIEEHYVMCMYSDVIYRCITLEAKCDSPPLVFLPAGCRNLFLILSQLCRWDVFETNNSLIWVTHCTSLLSSCYTAAKRYTYKPHLCIPVHAPAPLLSDDYLSASSRTVTGDTQVVRNRGMLVINYIYL